MMKKLMTVSEVSDLILTGQNLTVSGSEKCLTQLPKGNWIGGTIPYFMSKEGGEISHEKLLVSDTPDETTKVSFISYTENQLNQIPQNYMTNGFSIIIIPSFSNIQVKYAKECATWPGIFNQPLVGWVSGMDLKTSDVPKVINGITGEFFTDRAVVMHVELKPGYETTANIINIFKPNLGDTIEFKDAGFEFETALINGKETQLADYIEKNKIDLKLPLVADYSGAMINVSFRDINPITKKVRFYAPLFPGVTYYHAKSFVNYEKEFEKAVEGHDIENPQFVCNCILNFLHANLEGKKSGDVATAMTFGEIAYMLLNQTFVYLTVRRS